MERENVIELYTAISTIFEGDYVPEEDIIEYDDTYANDEEYTNAVVDMFMNNPSEWNAYVEGAKDFFPEMYGDEYSSSCIDMKGFKTIYSKEFKILCDNDFFK